MSLGSRYLREDKLASEIAFMLRSWSDLDAAERILTAEHGVNSIIALAIRYERARRSAFPPSQFPIRDRLPDRGTSGREHRLASNAHNEPSRPDTHSSRSVR